MIERNYIEELQKILPLPRKSLETGNSEDWDRVEMKLGLTLPEDYKEFINIYGTSYIEVLDLNILNPFSKNAYLNLWDDIFKKGSLWALGIIKKEGGEEQCPYPIYPQPQGLVPFGKDGNGATLYWFTKGNTDQWKIVINEGRGPEFEEYNESMSSLLVKLLKQELVSNIITHSGQSKTN
jgi:hypothetical protein